ncbi:dihydroxy-acid dehydratase family protein [Vibrio sp. SCSIO 43132]|uniref:IlvD/Edd family dehydratase n=1 Tax=Vibrio sp. SCSIO 43132 TaxID=2779363 RepID=UPI001CA8F77A|nr:IlvD/Edd family dehydratase [Vibrio sp. SCSIO 43132]UAB73318.1 dihydroxy-acid dehydratase family protein [Vibrio sp. SCSIO 43132]
MKLRSQQWFNNSDDPGMTALHLGHCLNYGLTREELQSGKPIIGIAQTGSDLSPCNRHHVELAKRVREGIVAAGGICLEFPVHPIQETSKRPTASLDRNLAYLGLVESLYGYPLDGVVLTIGCDKTTPALLMAAATVNIPAIALSVGPMLNGWHEGKRAGTGTVIWTAREKLATGEIDYEEFMDMATASVPSVGYCNTMGTASTMNSLAEALGMQLSGSAAIPAPYRQRGQMAYNTGQRIVELVEQDIKPCDVMTKAAFENAIAVNSAIGGSSNAPIHLNAVARHCGIELTNDDWQRVGYDIPLLCNVQPAGQFLGEDFYHAGGVPAVISELLKTGRLPNPDALTVSGQSIGELCQPCHVKNYEVIHPIDNPILSSAGFINLKGNLFNSAMMKTSVISDEFRQRYLSNPDDPNAFEGKAYVFDGPEDYHQKLESESIKEMDENAILVMRGAGPIGYPGAAEVVNMHPPAHLLSQGIHSLPCIGDGRQSGTSGSPSILNASPEAAVGGGLALLQTGDRIRIDLELGSADMLVDEEVLEQRRIALAKQGGYPYPAHQTPWQEIQRGMVAQLDEGMVLKPAVKYQKIAQKGLPRENH